MHTSSGCASLARATEVPGCQRPLGFKSLLTQMAGSREGSRGSRVIDVEADSVGGKVVGGGRAGGWKETSFSSLPAEPEVCTSVRGRRVRTGSHDDAIIGVAIYTKGRQQKAMMLQVCNDAVS